MSSPRKRDHDESEDFPPSSPSDASSLPPSSPPLPFDDEEVGGEGDIPDVDALDDALEEEEGEDLFGDNLARDYGSDLEQDRYDLNSDVIDDASEIRELDAAERRRVDELLMRRDRAARSGLDTGNARQNQFLQEDEDGAREGDGLALPSRRRRRDQFEEEPSDMDEDDSDDEFVAPMSLRDMGDVKAPSVAEWVTQPAVSRGIAHEFKNFLLEYTDENGRSIYGTRIRALGEVNAESLVVDYGHLVESRAVLAYFLAVAPAEVLKILDVVAMSAVELIYPFYAQIHPEIHVRITGLPTSFSLRDLREQHLNSLIRVRGVVTRRTGVFPQLKYVKFDCRKCGQILGPYVQDSNQEVHVSFCHNCQSRGPFTLNSEKTLYRNYQRATLQESPGTVPAGRLPRQRDVILLWDLIDAAKPGDEIEVTGIYKNAYDGSLNARNGFPVFRTVLEANSVQSQKSADRDTMGLTEAEETEVRQLARDPNIVNKIVASIAPSIYGHNDIKTALACSLFGGVAKETGKISLRGDINVLLLGDPGTAKSQLLKYAEQTAHRAVFATGQGASAVGLTASVRKDVITREWTLEGGALVLADKGTCLIDEFDKMNDQDRTSIHEAMEQQSISISKAGIVANLQARCAVMAAANPIGGRYNAAVPLAQNVDLTEPILSRFDILCVVRDLVNPETDERLAQFVVESHSRAHSGAAAEEQEGPIPQAVLRNYIRYARQRVRPQLMHIDVERITALYTQLRQEARQTGSFPITVRHLESIIRLSEAFARMRLSEYVARQDVDRAVRVAVNSFVGAQKANVSRSLRRSFARFL